uniref:Pyroglutamyl-peptidase I like n=1 Tax=Podarcis muralis TaxID=64176 RepID=A0A670J7Y8_PODMU|nr:pyroglutamyl-peptidase 1-like protein [Podarcis muralis]XP_028563075.1 pyroglutamyl-peptidase 1-like protein [Podarcis muralis]XP_028563076.1 pyroglutamyl-peptidase 1-like protein [Podarcis muralis]XP_028563077.1 pyroglutamyl-peptidase 1-like protein [Podarcis muralis]
MIPVKSELVIGVRNVKDLNEMDINSDTVVVTGFGPFRQHLVNSSWEAAKELARIGLGSDVDLHIMELPVAYKKAREIVCQAWATLHPQVMIHIGLVSTSKAIIILEQCGKNKGYKEKDACGFCPEKGCCVLEGPERIDSTINLKSVWKNVQVEGMDVIFSRDAGRYVCDYIYYTSLYYGNGRAAFIHVPPLSQWVTAELLGRALQTVILEILKQCKQGIM